MNLNRPCYAPLFYMPRDTTPGQFDYYAMREAASHLQGYVRVKVDVRAALKLAEKSAQPRAVKVAMMKQVANTRNITLEQCRILLGFAAQRAIR